MTKEDLEKKKELLKKSYKEKIVSYIKSVERSKTTHSELERLMVKRYQSEKTKKWKWVYDEEKALAPLIWIALMMHFPYGDAKGGKPMILEPWQAFIVSQLFGWYDKDYKVRRYRDAYIEVPRKNGKSTFIGALCAYMAFSKNENDGSPCYVGATSLDQAGEVFRRIARGLSHHKNVIVQDSKNNKVIKWNGGTIIAISGEPKDGKLAHFTIIDEYHQHKNNILVNSIASGNVADDKSMLVKITTAGTDLYSVCKLEHDKCEQILRGTLVSERYFVAIYTIDKNDNVALERTWKKANPNWGVSVSADSFKAQYDNCKFSTSEMIDFKTKNLNVWVSGLDRWANMVKWNTLCCKKFKDDIMKGGVCYAGLDLATVSDFTAFTVDRLKDGVHYQKYFFWLPEERVLDLERQLRVPLREWIQKGYIYTTDGGVVDYSRVAEDIKAIKDEYNVELIAYDKRYMNYLAPLMPEISDSMFEFSQALMSMSPCIKEFERLYLNGLIQSGDNPVMKWMMSSAESKEDAKNNIQLVKPSRSGSLGNKMAARIDGVIASIMAVDTSATHTNEDSVDFTDKIKFYTF